jgi:glycosyltransferase involved in cell wall biosynthesis
MKILSIAPFVGSYPFTPSGGGKGKFAYTLNRWLATSKGCEVTVIPWKEAFGGSQRLGVGDGASVAIEGVGDCIQGSVARTLLKRGFTSKRRLRNRLGEILDKVRPDVIHSHYMYSDFAEVLHETGSAVPSILTCHSGAPYNDAARVEQGLQRSTALVFVSRHDLEFASADHPDIRPKSRVIPCPSAPGFSGSLLPGKRNGILFVGVLEQRKNVRTLIDAMADVENRRLTICGDGPQASESREWARPFGDKIEFRGHMNEAGIRDLLKQAEMLVVPSLKEGFAVVYMEALCCGTPIIGYPPNVREHKENLGCEVGRAFDAATQGPKDLAGLIRDLAGDPLMDSERRSLLAERAQRAYSQDGIFSRYLEMYRELTGR